MKKYIKRIRGWNSEGKHEKRKSFSLYLRDLIKEDFGYRIKVRP